MSKIDISSTAIEKGLDLAKGFLSKLIGPTIEETGLLFKDKVAFWRFRNQVKMVNRANEFCIKNNISTKNIPLKIISPILDYAALEEEDELQDKWSILLSNMVDSEQNIENHVFPHILSQLSKKEFELIEAAVNQRFKERKHLKSKLESLQNNSKEEIDNLQSEIQNLKEKYEAVKEKESFGNIYRINGQKLNFEKQLRKIITNQDQIKREIEKAPYVFSENIQAFELANLIRLGIVKSISRQYAYIESSSLPIDPHDESVSLDEIEINVEPDYEEYTITQLGEIFIDVCTEKGKKII